MNPQQFYGGQIGGSESYNAGKPNNRSFFTRKNILIGGAVMVMLVVVLAIASLGGTGKGDFMTTVFTKGNSSASYKMFTSNMTSKLKPTEWSTMVKNYSDSYSAYSLESQTTKTVNDTTYTYSVYSLILKDRNSRDTAWVNITEKKNKNETGVDAFRVGKVTH